MKKLKAYIRLTRPANLPTAVADIIAGAAVSTALIMNSGGLMPGSRELVAQVVLLSMASVLLYASGVVLNDYFDRGIDAVERPERPIPSGIVAPMAAAVFGFTLMGLGVFTGFLVSPLSGILGVILAVSILSYDAWAKRNTTLGPLNMGLCRGLNLLLGMSLFGEVQLWWMAIIPVLYIGAITLISRGEVQGKNRNHILIAFFLYLTVFVFLTGLNNMGQVSFVFVLPFLVGFAVMTMVPLMKAYRQNTPENIRKAVRAGVISLILLDACIAVIFAGWRAGLSILVLLPVSLFLSRQFAVT
ncbi:UbiA-like protein EboC [Robertkochia flava]|uniref:UbiA-like protein EboC n=1 Tax=Robertkochia flava TaxID=3447986 RepID=UPI001CC96C1B|nr:UbiA-like protein EboC [Robertkochia marina]